MMRFPYYSIGAPARTVGWRDLGFTQKFLNKFVAKHCVCIFNSFLDIKVSWKSVLMVFAEGLLWWYFRYSYRMGHILSNGSYIWSKTYSFKSSPYPRQDSLQRIIIFGDMGKVKQAQNFFFFFKSNVPTQTIN